MAGVFDFFIADPEDLPDAFPGWMEVGEKTLKAKHPFTGKEVLAWAPITRHDAGPENRETPVPERSLFGLSDGRKKKEDPPPAYRQKFPTFATENIDYGSFPALLAAALGKPYNEMVFLQFDKPALISPRRPKEELFEVRKELAPLLAQLTEEGKVKLSDAWRRISAEECGGAPSAAEAQTALGKLADLAREAESLGLSMYYYCSDRPLF